MGKIQFKASAIGGEIGEYTPKVPFHLPCFSCTTTMEADDIITIEKDNPTRRHIPGYGAIYRIFGDGDHEPEFDVRFKKTLGSGDFDITAGALNLICFIFDGVDYWYSIPGGISGRGNMSELLPENDETGLVRVSCNGKHYKGTDKVTDVHGMLEYNGYLYVIGISPEWVDGVGWGGYYFLKMNVDDYNDALFTRIYYGEEDEEETDDPIQIGLVTTILECGGYLYATGFVSGVVGTSILIQYDTITDEYKIFKLPDIYGEAPCRVRNQTPISDGTYLYVVCEAIYEESTYVFRYLASDFQNPLWSKYEIDYGAEGVPVTPSDVWIFEAPDNARVTASMVDDNYLYLAYSPVSSFQEADTILKVVDFNGVVQADIDIPSPTDDMTQTDAYVFIGSESLSGDEQILAINKITWAVTYLSRRVGVADFSYGLFLFNIGERDYLFDLRVIPDDIVSSQIQIIDISDPGTWSEETSDNHTVHILHFDASCIDNFEFKWGVNEIVLSDNDVCHISVWPGMATIFKFKLNPLWVE